MFYRVQPNGRITSNTTLTDSLLKIVQRENADLDLLEWTPVEQDVNYTDVVRVALRHGHPTGSGLIVHLKHLAVIDRPRELRNLLAKEENTQRPMPPAFVLDQDPDYRARREQEDAEFRESYVTKIREADEELEAELNAPVKAELLEWWKQLGGVEV